MNHSTDKVLFICTHNSCRSQMAEGLLNDLDNTHYEAYSAGIEKTTVHPLAIKVMEEIGIDISNNYSKTIDQLKDISFDYVVTVCDGAIEVCPFYPGKIHIHQSFKDPSLLDGDEGDQLHEFRKIRDEIKVWIKEFFS